ncbi:transposase [Vibrio chagasii]|nr:transposase [Vibrio chagasii]
MASNIEAVAMDMNTAFDLEVQAHCPNAKIVYDLFHVLLLSSVVRSWIESESTKPTNSSKIKSEAMGQATTLRC